VLHALGLDLHREIISPSAGEAPPEVLALAQQRWEAKQNKDWATSDALRKEAEALGWTIKDTKEGFEVVAK
jgi:cysteinyl-tRNA synthetase